MEMKDIDKITADLLKKSLQKPESKNFDDSLMGKIMELPKPTISQADSKLFKNGWRFLILALVLLITSVVLLSYLTAGNNTEISKILMATKIYIIYGGMALFVPLLFTQLDSLLKILFENRLKPRMNY